MKVLIENDLMIGCKEATWIYYTLNRKTFSNLLQFMGMLTQAKKTVSVIQSKTNALRAETKYYYSNEFRILVIKCKNCKTFHAVISSFSLSGTSLGTALVEDFLIKRELKKSRKEAGELLIEAGVSFRHLKNIEKLFNSSLSNMKSLLPDNTGDYTANKVVFHIVSQKQQENITLFAVHDGENHLIGSIFEGN